MNVKRNSPVRFALVGAGAIAQSYLQVFGSLDGAKLTWVCDSRPEAAQAVADMTGCSTCTEYIGIPAGDIDAVIVCTPPQSHPEICVHFLRQGIHVICEKPLSIDTASARQMVEAAEESGAKFTMASKFRYVEDVVRARSIIASGILGQILLFENSFTSRVNMSGRWNADPQISGGGVLIDNGTHSVDIARYLLGPLTDVQAVEGLRSQNLSVEDTASIFVRSASGVRGNIFLSWSVQRDSDAYISVYGTHGTVIVGWKESRFRQCGNADWTVFGGGYNKVQALRSQMNNFIGAIRGEEQLLITAGEAYASVEVIEAAFDSLGKNKWTSIVPKQLVAVAKSA